MAEARFCGYLEFRFRLLFCSPCSCTTRPPWCSWFICLSQTEVESTFRATESRSSGSRSLEKPEKKSRLQSSKSETMPSRSGNVWDNAAMESFFSSLKTERTARKMYRSRDEAKADVFDYIECFYNPKRRHSTIGYISPMEFERQAGLA